jgi:hypothetical protein
MEWFVRAWSFALNGQAVLDFTRKKTVLFPAYIVLVKYNILYVSV